MMVVGMKRRRLKKKITLSPKVLETIVEVGDVEEGEKIEFFR